MLKYTVLTMAGLLICLVKVLQGFEYASILNMSQLETWQSCESPRVTQGAEYALTMRQYP